MFKDGGSILVYMLGKKEKLSTGFVTKSNREFNIAIIMRGP